MNTMPDFVALRLASLMAFIESNVDYTLTFPEASHIAGELRGLAVPGLYFENRVSNRSAELIEAIMRPPSAEDAMHDPISLVSSSMVRQRAANDVAQLLQDVNYKLTANPALAKLIADSVVGVLFAFEPLTLLELQSEWNSATLEVKHPPLSHHAAVKRKHGARYALMGQDEKREALIEESTSCAPGGCACTLSPPLTLLSSAPPSPPLPLPA